MMIPRCPRFLLTASVLCVGALFANKPAVLATDLSIGVQNDSVAELQRSLKVLGYFEGEVSGLYGESTAAAVSQFQRATSLPGITSPAIVAKAPTAKPDSLKSKLTSPWVLGGIAVSGVVATSSIVLLRRRRRTIEEEIAKAPLMLPEASLLSDALPIEESVYTPLQPIEAPVKEVVEPSGQVVREVVREASPETAKPDHPRVTETTRLPKINIVDELIQDLRSPDPAKRNKVIWELGQRGDTRAVQPLVDLMIDADSRQRSLILSSLSEIGTRTLKPLTRALAISLQDENADVRKNAIRDLTRVYDMVAQISHLLSNAADDPDPDVQETARWALGQLNRIRSAPGVSALPSGTHSVSPPEKLG